MSGSGLWFSRFAGAGEGWLPLVAFGSAAWVFWSAAQAPDVLEDVAVPVASTSTTPPRAQTAMGSMAQLSETPRPNAGATGVSAGQ